MAATPGNGVRCRAVLLHWPGVVGCDGCSSAVAHRLCCVCVYYFCCGLSCRACTHQHFSLLLPHRCCGLRQWCRLLLGQQLQHIVLQGQGGWWIAQIHKGRKGKRTRRCGRKGREVCACSCLYGGSAPLSREVCACLCCEQKSQKEIRCCCRWVLVVAAACCLIHACGVVVVAPSRGHKQQRRRRQQQKQHGVVLAILAALCACYPM